MPGRVESYFDNPNTFAEVLILLLPLVLALILCSKRGISRVTACGVFAVGVLALGMTYSRASWVGMACAMVVLVFLWKPKLIPAFAVLCVVMVPFLPDTIWHRVLTIFNPADTSTASRIPLYQAALEVIRTSPVSGAGLGTAAVQDYISDFNLYHAEAPFVHAHNFYLQVWIEAGLLGFLGFVGSMLWNIKKAARTVRHWRPLCRPHHHLCRSGGSVRRHGVRSGGLPVELSPGDVHFLVRVRADHRGDQGLPPGDGGGLMEERNCPMEDPFAFLTLDFLKKSEIFPGSLGTFRYRFQRMGKVNDGTVQAWVYENICFEKAQHIETETFPWTEEGMASLRSWLNERLRERGSELYRVWGGR